MSPPEQQFNLDGVHFQARQFLQDCRNQSAPERRFGGVDLGALVEFPQFAPDITLGWLQRRICVAHRLAMPHLLRNGFFHLHDKMITIP